MSKLQILWFKLTWWLPRKLPRTQKELENFQQTLVLVWGAHNNEKVWYTIISNMASTAPIKNKRSWYELFVIGDRLEVNEFLHGERSKIVKSLEAQLEEAAKKVVAEAEQAKKDEIVLPPVSEVKTNEPPTQPKHQ